MDGELLADQPLGEKLIKKGFWLYLFTFLITPTGYIIKVIVSNKLSVEDIGLFYSILSFLFIISLYSDLGLTEALQYFLPKYRINKEYNKYKTITIITWIAQFISGAIIGGLLYFGAPWLALHYFKNPNAIGILQTMAYMYFGLNFIQVFSSFFTAFQNVITTNIVEGTRMYATLCFCLYLLVGGTLNISTFPMGWVVGTYIGIFIGGVIFFKKYGGTLRRGKFERDIKIIKRQLHYARRVFLGANVSTLLLNINQQMSIFFLGSSQAGYFSNFLSIFTVFTFLVSPLIAFLFPIVTELLEKKQTEKFSLLLQIFYKYFSLIALIFSGLFIALGPEIGMVLFGTKFIYSGDLVIYTAPFLIINLLYTINFYILGGMGKVKERVWFLFRGLLGNIAISILGIYLFHWGIMAILGGMVIGRGILFFLTRRSIHAQWEIKFNWNFFFKNLIIIGILSSIIYYIKTNIFIVNNGYRRHNLLYLCIIVSVYILVIGGVNYKNIGYLLQEIKIVKR